MQTSAILFDRTSWLILAGFVMYSMYTFFATKKYFPLLIQGYKTLAKKMVSQNYIHRKSLCIWINIVMKLISPASSLS